MKTVGHSCANILRASAAALAGVLLSLSAWAGNTLQSVTASIQSGREVIRVDLTEALPAEPAGFSIQSPARIALDFPGTANGMGRSSIDFNQGNLKSVSVVQSGERTRVVLNLKQYTSYKTEIDGKSILVTLDPLMAAVPPVNAAGGSFTEGGSLDVLPIKDLDFKRGPENMGRIIVGLPNNQVGVDIRQQGQNLVVDFLKSSLPQGLRRKIDVSDFGSPIQVISASQVQDRVRVVVEPKGAWEHSAYQTENSFVLEIRPQKIDANKLSQGVGYTGEKLSLNFQNIEVRSLLQVIADFTNFNIVTSDTVGGAVTLRLKDVPWDQALDIILQARNLGMRKSGNVLWIAPKDELAAKEKQDLEAQAAIQGLEPLRTQSFQLNYTKAADIAAQIATTSGGTGSSSRILSGRGSAIAEPRTNQIFVTDIPSKLAQVQELLNKLDVAVRQVMIEARIVEADDSFLKSIGVRLGGADLRGVSGGDAGYTLGGTHRVAFAGTYDAVTGTTGQTSNSVDSDFFNFSVSGAPSFAVSMFSAAANRFLNLEISALESDGKGKVVASPRVVTADQTKALIEQGTRIPYQSATSSGATAISFANASLKLEVTPQITPEGNIILDLDVNKDSVGASTSSGPLISTKHVKTQVLIENGGTVVIGGIFELTESVGEQKVPFFGDLPVVGNLFKSNSKSWKKSELLVFITPKVIADRSLAR